MQVFRNGILVQKYWLKGGNYHCVLPLSSTAFLTYPKFPVSLFSLTIVSLFHCLFFITRCCRFDFIFIYMLISIIAKVQQHIDILYRFFFFLLYKTLDNEEIKIFCMLQTLDRPNTWQRGMRLVAEISK